MASSAEIVARIDNLLDGISEDVSALPALAKSWDRMPEKEKVVWDIEWSEQMRRLEGLDVSFRAGAMSAEQEARYRAVLLKIRELQPVIRSLDLESAAKVLKGEAA